MPVAPYELSPQGPREGTRSLMTSTRTLAGASVLYEYDFERKKKRIDGTTTEGRAQVAQVAQKYGRLADWQICRFITSHSPETYKYLVLVLVRIFYITRCMPPPRALAAAHGRILVFANYISPDKSIGSDWDKVGLNFTTFWWRPPGICLPKIARAKTNHKLISRLSAITRTRGSVMASLRAIQNTTLQTARSWGDLQPGPKLLCRSVSNIYLPVAPMSLKFSATSSAV